MACGGAAMPWSRRRSWSWPSRTSTRPGRGARRGAGRVVLVPYFLSAGVHVRRDLTAARDRLAARFPGVEFRLAEPLGRHPLLLEVVEERVRETIKE